MYGLLTHQRYWHDNNDEIDCHVSDCIREKHSKCIHAFLFEYRKGSPIGVEVLATSCSNCNEESQHPQDDDSYRNPADDVELVAAEYPPIEKADGDFQKTKGYGIYQIEGSL